MPTRLFAVLIAYLHFFYSHGREEEETGEENILSKKKELIVQKLSSEPKISKMKFTREGSRESVEYN